MLFFSKKNQLVKRKRLIRKISKFRDMVNRKQKWLKQNITPQQQENIAHIITNLTLVLSDAIDFNPTGTRNDTTTFNALKISFTNITISQWGNVESLLPSIWLIVLEETWENLKKPTIKGLTVAKLFCFMMFIIFSWGLRESILESSFNSTEGNLMLDLMVWITPIYASLIQMRHQTGTDLNGKKEIGFNFWGAIFALVAGMIGVYFIVGHVSWIPIANTGWQEPLNLLGIELMTAVIACSGISVLRDTK